MQGVTILRASVSPSGLEVLAHLADGKSVLIGGLIPCAALLSACNGRVPVPPTEALQSSAGQTPAGPCIAFASLLREEDRF